MSGCFSFCDFQQLLTLNTQLFIGDHVDILEVSFFFFKSFVYFWLHGFLQLWRAGATLRCSAQASHCSGFSCCGARAVGTQASVVVSRRLSSCGSRDPELRLSSCGARAQLFRHIWDLPRPGLEPMSPALAGGFLTTAPPGKPSFFTHQLDYFSKKPLPVNIHFITQWYMNHSLRILTCINGKFLDKLTFEQHLLMLSGSLINLGKLINTFI